MNQLLGLATGSETPPDIPRAHIFPGTLHPYSGCSASATIFPLVAVRSPAMTTLALFWLTDTATPTPMELLFCMSVAATPVPTVLKFPLLLLKASMFLAVNFPLMLVRASCRVTLTPTAAATWILWLSCAEASVLAPERASPTVLPMLLAATGGLVDNIGQIGIISSG